MPNSKMTMTIKGIVTPLQRKIPFTLLLDCVALLLYHEFMNNSRCFHIFTEKTSENGKEKKQTARKRFTIVYNIELTALISFLNSICCVCPYFVLTTADIYSHLDANAKSEAGRAIESVLSINSESED